MALPSNSTPPYQHWHAACGACSRLIFVAAITPPGPLYRPSVKVASRCPHCEHTQDYEPEALILHSGSGTLFASDSSNSRGANAAAVIAGFVAAVRLARIESSEIAKASPRFRSVIADSVTVARAILAELGRRGN